MNSYVSQGLCLLHAQYYSTRICIPLIYWLTESGFFYLDFSKVNSIENTKGGVLYKNMLDGLYLLIFKDHISEKKMGLKLNRNHKSALQIQIRCFWDFLTSSYVSDHATLFNGKYHQKLNF